MNPVVWGRGRLDSPRARTYSTEEAQTQVTAAIERQQDADLLLRGVIFSTPAHSTCAKDRGRASIRRAVEPTRRPPSRAGVVAAIMLAALALAGGAASPAPPGSASQSTDTARQLRWEIVRSSPHDPRAFLQGLVWHDGGFFESTGRLGQSTLRRVEWPTGRVLRRVDLPPDVFGEGLARVGDRLVQLTWRSGRGFVYDLATLRLLREFRYEGEGWGLAYDGTSLILSDGTNVLTYLDPGRYTPTRTLAVTWNGQPLHRLNELEFIEGAVWANVWHTDFVVQIDPASGRVTSFLDLTGLRPSSARRQPEAVLNGLAYDPATRRLFVGGKLWPLVFEIRVR
jgi:glutamine cyclotransferase